MSKLTTSKQHIAGNSIHPFTRQLQANLQQLLRQLRLFPLHNGPILLIQQPSNTIPFRSRGACPLCTAEERKLAAGRPLND